MSDIQNHLFNTPEKSIKNHDSYADCPNDSLEQFYKSISSAKTICSATDIISINSIKKIVLVPLAHFYPAKI